MRKRNAHRGRSAQIKGRRDHGNFSCQELEPRRLFAFPLFPAFTDTPDVFFGTSSLDPAKYPLQYQAGTLSVNLAVDATPSTVKFPSAPSVQQTVFDIPAPPGGSITLRDFKINIRVASNGSLVGGVDNVDDLMIVGQVTDTNALPQPVTYSSVLLTGEIEAFAFRNSSVAADMYQFMFRPTGGSLLNLYGNKYIGVKVDSSNSSSTFNGSFATEFHGTALGDAAPITNPNIDLSLTKTVNNPTPNVGTDVTYSLSLANAAGFSAATGVKVSDVLPSGMTLVSASTAQGTFSGGIWNVGTVASGASAALNIVAHVNAGAYPSATNTAQVSSADQHDIDSTPGNNAPSEDDQSSVTIAPQLIDLSLKKTVNDSTPNVGDTVAYTIRLDSDAFYSTATGVAVRDLLPSGVTFVSASASVGSYDDETGIWSVGTLASGDSADLTILATADVPQQVVTNRAEVYTADQPDFDSTAGDGGGRDPAQDDEAVATLTAEQIDLSILKTVDDSTPNVNQQITFTITLNNAAGFSTATGVQVTDTLPAGLAILSASSLDYNTLTGVWNVGTLASGASTTLQVTAVVSADAYPSVINTAEVTAANQPDKDSTPKNHNSNEDDLSSVTVSTVITPSIALLKETNGSNHPFGTEYYVSAGSLVNWTYTVTNTGDVSLGSVALTDDQGVTPVLDPSGDVDHDGLLDPKEVWVYSASGTATADDYVNVANATGKPVNSVGVPLRGASVVTATDDDRYYGYTSNISIQKLTNGTDNAAAPGTYVSTGSPVTWTYQVSTTGNVPLANATVTDSVATVTPGYVSGDDGDGLLEAGETWIFTASGTAVAGQYSNVGTATGTPVTLTGGAITGATSRTASDADYYFGSSPSIQLVKLTNNTNNNTGTGPVVPVGSVVTWTYSVTNIGNVPLGSVVVADDQAGVSPVYSSGNVNNNHLLDLNETWIYSATGSATAGQYTNRGSVSAKEGIGTIVSASDVDHYFGYTSNISIQKLTNGTDNNSAPGLTVQTGSAVTWTYLVSTTGNVPLANVSVTDSATGVTPIYVSGDDGDGHLEFGETWTYTAARTAIAGQYMNLGTVGGTPVTPTGSPISGASTKTASDVEYYFGVSSSIAGSVYKDVNFDGLKNPGEVGIDGVTVTLLRFDGSLALDVYGNTVAPALTSGGGLYTFTNLPTGNYKIIESQPSSYLDGYESQNSMVLGYPLGSDTINSIALAFNTTEGGYNFGEVPPASIGDLVFEDLNGNGIRDDVGESGIANVTVKLLTASGSVIAGSGAVTGAAGDYLINNLYPGTYGVQFIAPAGYTSTASDKGSDDTKDSDASTVTATLGKTTSNYTLTAGQSNTTVDAGLYRAATIGDYTFIDTNGNGQQDAGDSALPGVVVSLTGTTGAGTMISTSMTTTVSGSYQFTGLAPGVYSVKFTAPTGSGYVLTTANTGSDITDSDPSGTGTASGATGVTLTSNQFDNTIDAGFYRLGCLSGFVYYDVDNDGIKETGEAAIPNMTVTLLDSSQNVVASTPTNSSGAYTFANLKPGTYIISETQPGSYVDGKETVGSQGGDTGPGVNQITAKLGSGVSGINNNFGEVSLSSISGTVYVDANNNGVCDSGESTIGTDAFGKPIVITLTGTDDIGTVSKTTTTDTMGRYTFSDLRAGIYTIIEAQPTNFAPGKDSLGSINGVTTGENPLLLDNTLSLTLPFSSSAIKYNFGETIPTTLVTGNTGTIGFWRNQNGQALLSKINGSSKSKALSTWLSGNYPKLWGSSAGSANLSGKTNTEVAAYFATLFGTGSSLNPPKTECQILATAFAVYSTSSSLSGGSYAASYGFTVTSAGIGSKTISVMNNGGAFGVANNSSLSITQCLQKANANAVSGIVFAANSAYRSALNATFSAINEMGDIV